MNRRQIVLLAVILALLAVGITLKQFRKPRGVETQETASLVLNFDPSAAAGIKIQKGQTDPVIELVKKETGWVVPSRWETRADETKIKNLLAHIGRLKGEARGNSKELFGDFGIGDDQAFHVSVSKNGGSETVVADRGEILHLAIGVKNPGWQDLFVRLAGQDTVYLVSSPLLADLGIGGNPETAQLQPDTWVDLKLLSFDPEQVERVEIKEKGADWRELAGQLPFDKDPQKWTSYLENLRNTQAAGLADPQGKEYGFETPEWELKIALKEGNPIILTAGAAKSDSIDVRYVKISASPAVYYAPRYTLEKIKPDEGRFIAANPLGIDKIKLDKLTVHTPAEEISVTPKQESWPGLDEYLDLLKGLYLSKISSGEKTGGPGGKYWLEVQSEGKAALRLVCDRPVDAKSKEALCANSTNPVPFTITEATFQNLFEHPDRLRK